MLHDIRPLSAAVKAKESVSSKKPQQKRWSFAFKDTAIEGARGIGAAKGGTVIRDKNTGRLRAASPLEEKSRSWIKKRSKNPL